ncbi:MAG: DUF1009 domain-containing protein [Alphaproteobacteria bacterium]|nr:DUF1009 domain-containing protein [Alphaproteobacteria bacterium]
MSATQIKSLGIIAGKGVLPKILLDHCVEKGIAPVVVCFDGQENKSVINDNHPTLITHFGAAGQIINFFKQHNISDLVLIGGMKRPSFQEIRPDLKGVSILAKIGLKSLGDNSLLTLLKKELEHEGFTLHGIQNFCDDLLVPQGPLGKHNVPKSMIKTVEIGIKASQELGRLDIGQAVIAQQQQIIGVEGVEGTDALIERCAPLLKAGKNAVLIKTRKPQQDKNLDLPTIGIQTIENAYKAGLDGIVIHAENMLIIDSKTVAERADTYKMFVVGTDI